MASLSEHQARDSIGLPRFDEKRCKAMVEHVRASGLLVSEMPEKCAGDGIVVAGGGRYLSWSWVLCKRLRAMGCQLPIQLWHIGVREMPEWVRPEFKKLDVELVDVFSVMAKFPVRQMSGWILKNYAVAHSSFERVMFIDADCFPTVRPEVLFAEAGDNSLFFHDVKPCHPSQWGYVDCGLLPGVEWETGQFVVNKRTGWMGVRWTGWMNEHTDCFFRLFHGDKGTFEAGFRMANVPLVMGDPPKWAGYGIEHGFNGRPVFEHKMATKRSEWAMEKWLGDLFKEWNCLALGKQIP